MNEKISEIPVRKEKIKRLKEKIFAEIDKISKSTRKEIQYLLKNMTENELEDWDWLITREFSLLRLREFVKDKSAFQSYEARYEDKDIIIYQVSDKTLNIWLQEDYNFTLNFLCKVEYERFCDVYQILNNRYLGYEFTNIFDVIQYDNKIKNTD